MHVLENDRFKVSINPLGAELSSFYDKQKELDYMWSAEPAWAKHSPVLFPIVGTLKNNSYVFNGETYNLSRHGFGREKIFAITVHSDTAVSFTLSYDHETLQVYPFYFFLTLKYELGDAGLSLTYIIENSGKEDMYFSIGGHPAFKLPIKDELDYTDYYLQFNKKETAGRWPINKEGLIKDAPLPLLNDTDKLPLKKELFYEDAIVLKGLQSDKISLKTDKDAAGFDFVCEGFSFLGIWAAKDANFVCIEPWCGIADSVNASGKLEEKEGINKLEPSEKFERTWSVNVY